MEGRWDADKHLETDVTVAKDMKQKKQTDRALLLLLTENVYRKNTKALLSTIFDIKSESNNSLE